MIESPLMEREQRMTADLKYAIKNARTRERVRATGSHLLCVAGFVAQLRLLACTH